jgi:hypothetical protein
LLINVPPPPPIAPIRMAHCDRMVTFLGFLHRQGLVRLFEAWCAAEVLSSVGMGWIDHQGARDKTAAAVVWFVY